LTRIKALFFENKAQAAHKNVANCQYLIVPRHPQRFDEVAQLIAAQGWHCRRRADWGRELQNADEEPTIWLGDSLGEMAFYYSMADVALLGGSFAPLGGQNLIEAAACACPLVLGPHTFNFAQAAEQAVATGAALRVPDLSAALQAAHHLLADPSTLSHARAQALHFARSQQGGTEATAQQVLALCQSSHAADHC
ncbi:MAG: hypothetical protein RLZZ612_622, partial [Pseudomonadota bacterium]